jgi:hypothetical protein
MNQIAADLLMYVMSGRRPGPDHWSRRGAQTDSRSSGPMTDQSNAAAPAQTTPAAADLTPTGQTFVGRFIELKPRGGDDGKKRPFALIAAGPIRKYPTRAEADADTERTAGRELTGKAVYLTTAQVTDLKAAVAEIAAAAGKSPARIAAAMFASGVVSFPSRESDDITESDGFAAMFGPLTDDDDDDGAAAEPAAADAAE